MMTENKLGTALLNVNSRERSDSSECRAQTEKVLARSKRWVRLLTALVVFFSLLAALGIFLQVQTFYHRMAPVIDQVIEDLEKGEAITEYDPVVVGLGRLYWFWEFSLGITTASLVALMLAGFSTVWLILASHRGTIRHVNAGLAQISEQLRQLQEPAKEAPASG